VKNGGWHMMYDTSINGLFCCYTREAADSLVAVTKQKVDILWACNPESRGSYQDVINAARERYEYGEEANYDY
jgi:hypothetical protein